MSQRTRSAALAGAAGCAAVALAAPPARADFAPLAPWELVSAERRSGVVIGLSAGFGVASVAGFPNDPQKIGFQSAYTITGPKAAFGGAAWVGGALSDWLTFAIGVGRDAPLGLPAGEAATMFALEFHVEVFPAYGLGGTLRDVGAYVNAGTGPAKLTTAGQQVPLIDGGAAAFVGVGVFWERLRFWRIGAGPYVEAQYFWADSVRAPALLFGLRTALYTGKFAK
ncbi:MAG TPA: hypothetical protein VGM56_13810 [Byssovorax sp.]